MSLWPQRKKERVFAPVTKFALVVPAHNESAVIERTLKSLKALDYPNHLYNILVIADNCNDDTAEVVRKSGVACWERKDASNRGKGYALKWAFERLLKEGDHGAYVIIDVDTIVDSNFLKAMNQAILSGTKAIQGYYDVLHPERSPMGSLSYLGFVLSRNLRYKGRTRLGWTTNLLGNGMCFTREIIEQFGWPATSIVEDIEYEMIRHLNGVRVSFIPEAKVYAEIPDTFKRSKVQRGRWDIGKFEVRNRYLLKLMQEGFRKRDLSYFDSAMELLIPAFSIFAILAFTGFILFLFMEYNGPNLTFTSFVWFSMTFGMIIYIFTGLLLARASFRVYLSLFYAPYFLIWRLWVVIQGVFERSHQVWVKTERK